MAGIGTKPRDIGKPLAQASFAEQITPQVMPMPQGGTTPADVPVEPTAEDAAVLSEAELAELDSIYGTSAQADLSPEEIAELDAIYGTKVQDEETSDEPRSLEEKFSQLPMRMKASFARTDKETQAILEKEHGKENVRLKNGEFETREKGKWKKFDEEGVSMGDVADMSRDALEGAISMPARATGAVAGFLSPVPGGAMLGQAAGGALGNAAGTAVGDAVALGLGIERDPDRNAGTEYGLSAAFGAVLGPIGNWVGGKMAQRKLAREVVSKTDQVMSTAAKDLQESSQKMIEAGLMKPVGDSGKILTPDELAFENANQVALKNELLEKTQYQDFIMERVEMINGGMKKLFGKAGNLEASNSGKEIVLGMGDILKAEGRLIGSYRESLAQKAGDKLLKAENYKSTVDNLAQELGWIRSGDVLQAPSVDDLLGKGVVSSESEARGLINFMNKEFQGAYTKKGEYTAREISSKLAQLSERVSASFDDKNASVGARSAYLKVKNALRDDELNAMELYLQSPGGLQSRLGEGAKFDSDFQSIKNKYGAFKDATDTLSNMLKTDDISSTALVRGVFTKGKQGLPNLRAVKTILEAGDPKAYQDFVGQYLGDLITRNTDETAQRATKISYGKIQKELNNLGPEMLTELFGETGAKQADEFFKLASRADKGDVGFIADPKNVGMLKRLAVLGSGGWLAGQVSAGAAMVADLGKDKAVAKFLSSEANQEIILKGLPKAEQLRVRSFMQKVVDNASIGLEKTGEVGTKVLKNQMRQQAIDANAELNSKGPSQ